MKGHLLERSPGHWAIVIDARDLVDGSKKAEGALVSGYAH